MINNFHQGELTMHDQFGLRDKLAGMAQRMMHDFIPYKQRLFFESLEYLLLGTIDENGWSHASLITGEVGFVQTPTSQEMVIRTGPREHLPAFDALAVGQLVGVLGIEFSNRRRNRMHGRITSMNAETITIGVTQFYGNCPKYISIREISERGLKTPQRRAAAKTTLSHKDIDLITTSDTFFISSYVRDESGEPYEGVDISHRGGEPGFVSIDTNSQITIPDYSGNYLFNTIGNLLVNPEAGLLFIDFETGDQLHVHGQATLVENEAEVSTFSGAQRLLRIQIKSVRRQAAATSLRWRLVELSPTNLTINL